MTDEMIIIGILSVINIIQFLLLSFFAISHHHVSLELVNRDIEEKYGLRKPQQTLRELLKKVEELE